MSLPKHISLVLCLMAQTLLAPQSVQATDLRGKVMASNPVIKRTIPRRGARVELYREGDPTRPVNAVITGYNGMFYFYDIPPGRYVLHIEGRDEVPVEVPQAAFHDMGSVNVR
jgi:hypothetical protein